MRINTNVASLSAQNKLAATGNAAAKTIGRLSSGFRINSSADDAAGLGIANKLRAETRALKQAARNAEQANAMIQIMEGATTTIGSMLERMKELATQAASDNVDVGGRGRIDTEFQQLREEITRVVNTTKFQDQALINGSFGATVSAADGLEGITLSGARAGSYEVSVDSGTFTMRHAISGVSQEATAVDGVVSFSQFGISLLASSVDASDGNTLGITGSSASFLVSSSGSYGQHDLVTIDAVDLQVSSLGIDSAVIADLTDAGNAQTALTLIDAAIDTVNSTLGKFGAAQNRIEYATQNVKTTIENFSAAESTIRDADMAAEMSTFTKQQILQQAGVAMLAQANSAPQQILRLLQ